MRLHRILFAGLLSAALALVAAPRAAQASVAVSISVFHDDLAPYGRWVGVGSYGNCFVPRVAAGWAPYVDGQWVYTDYGWTWVSNDPFPDVPFHYGSWTWADPYGWVWVPGTVWAPAWVTWAYGDDYVGWAPVPPSFGFAATGYAGAAVVLPATRYVFVPTRQFVGVPVASVRLPVARNSVIFARTVKTTDYRVAGGIVRTAGPPTERIERVAGTKVAPVSIDRVKARPTTIADAGGARASHLRVAAPASETRKLAATGESQAAAKNEPRARAAPKTKEKAPAAAAAHHETAPPAQAEQREAPKEQAPAARAPTETHAAAAHEKAAPGGKAAPKPSASAQKHAKKPLPEKAPAHEAAPNPSAAERRAEPAKPEAAPRTEPREDTRVAAHNPPHPAAHPAHPAPARPKPPENKPEKGPEQKPE